MLLTDNALPSTTKASESTLGVASSVITTANACCGPPVEPLPMSILPPCLTQVTEDGFNPARSLPPTLTWACVPEATDAPLDPGAALLDPGAAEWPLSEQATSTVARLRVPIPATRRLFTGFPSLMRRHVGVVLRQVQNARLATDPIFLVQSTGRVEMIYRRELPDGKREMAGRPCCT